MKEGESAIGDSECRVNEDGYLGYLLPARKPTRAERAIGLATG
jgi:hypothetical protein